MTPDPPSSEPDPLAAAAAEARAPGVTPADLATSGEEAGDIIDRYKLLECIGEGGFGTVWMAEQFEPVKRKVALKIIKLGMDTKQVIARFEAERQALALMEHPHIAQVLDGGATQTGRPYFVMELVRGVSITEFCDEARLDVQQRVELFIQVCGAIQHAHHKGVIHRDVKPSNVLVTLHDGVPVPKVIDFGIAKATSAELTAKTLFTEFRQMVGTPESMAPEQAEMSGLDVDTRADVYGLGVLLYELLTGTKPFDVRRALSKGYEELLRVIREEEPAKPSTRTGDASVASSRATEQVKLGSLLRGELDWIVLKALEKDRTRRYDTASGLADDLRSYLAGEEITAGRPSRMRRYWRFVRRNRTVAVSAAAIAVLLVVGLFFATYTAARAARERDVAQRLHQEATTARMHQEEARRQAEAASAFLADMLTSADPQVRGEDVSVEELLAASAASIGTQFADEPLLEARLRQTIAQTYVDLDLYAEAEPQLLRTYELRKAHLGADHTGTLDSIRELIALYAAWETADEAGGHAERGATWQALLESLGYTE